MKTESGLILLIGLAIGLYVDICLVFLTPLFLLMLPLLAGLIVIGILAAIPIVRLGPMSGLSGRRALGAGTIILVLAIILPLIGAFAEASIRGLPVQPPADAMGVVRIGFAGERHATFIVASPPVVVEDALANAAASDGWVYQARVQKLSQVARLRRLRE